MISFLASFCTVYGITSGIFNYSINIINEEFNIMINNYNITNSTLLEMLGENTYNKYDKFKLPDNISYKKDSLILIFAGLVGFIVCVLEDINVLPIITVISIVSIFVLFELNNFIVGRMKSMSKLIDETDSIMKRYIEEAKRIQEEHEKLNLRLAFQSLLNNDIEARDRYLSNINATPEALSKVSINLNYIKKSQSNLYLMGKFTKVFCHIMALIAGCLTYLFIRSIL